MPSNKYRYIYERAEKEWVTNLNVDVVCFLLTLSEILMQLVCDEYSENISTTDAVYQ